MPRPNLISRTNEAAPKPPVNIPPSTATTSETILHYLLLTSAQTSTNTHSRTVSLTNPIFTQSNPVPIIPHPTRHPSVLSICHSLPLQRQLARYTVSIRTHSRPLSPRACQSQVMYRRRLFHCPGYSIRHHVLLRVNPY